MSNDKTKSYDESLEEVREELKKRGLGTYQAANPNTGLYNLDLLWGRVFNYDSAKSAKDAARAAKYSMVIAIASLILNAAMVISQVLGVFSFRQ